MMLLIDVFSMINPQLIRWTIDNGIQSRWDAWRRLRSSS